MFSCMSRHARRTTLAPPEPQLLPRLAQPLPPGFEKFRRNLSAICKQQKFASLLPAWFTELAHYEWVELAVDIMDCPIPPHDPAGNLLIGQPLLNPTLMNLDYQWPVHMIGPNYRPRKIQPSQLLVFRDREDKVRFVASTPVTSRLLKLVGERGLNGRAACLHIASELHHPAPEALVSHGHAMLSQLREQGIILGTKS